MKKLINATMKSRAMSLSIIDVILSIISITINSQILLWVGDAVANYNDPMKWLAFVVTGCLVNTIIDLVASYTKAITVHKIYTELSNQLTEKLAYSDYDLFVKHSPGEIETINGNLWMLSKLIPLLVSVTKDAVNIVVVLFMIVRLEIKLFIPLVVIYGVGTVMLKRTIKQWSVCDAEMDAVKHRRNGELDELINGFAEVRSFAYNATYHRRKITQYNDDIMGAIVNRTRASRNMSSVINVVDTLAMLVVLVYGIYALREGILESSATAVTLVMFCWRIIQPLIAIIEKVDMISGFKAPLPKFEELMDYKNKVVHGITKLDSFDREIAIDNVKFSYDESSYVLDGVTFTVKKGERVGVCGVSGGGKSTLLKLIPHFYDVSSGSIKIDGLDLRELDRNSLKKHIGMVHQNTHIFNGTIRENVKYATYGMCQKDERTVTDEQIVEACKKAAIYDFIMSLPNGFDTEVGPRGLKLSGGQKQRIALARLFLTNPDIIILDEATSALDNDTERFIQESLESFSDKTMIVVAHRLTTIKDFDKIVVIDQHKVAEQGTHDELMALGGIYAGMYK